MQVAEARHLKVTAQVFNIGSTNVTPQVLNILATNPQIIISAVTPGTGSTVWMKAIRAQDSTIPISECIACSVPSFVAAMGGPAAMSNIFASGTETQLRRVSSSTIRRSRQSQTSGTTSLR